jgi:hypothetical protein
MRALAVAAAVVIVAAPSRPLRADDANFRPYVVGGRAAGMGGAFTAIADDGSAPYYNPGGLAFVRRSQLSLSGSVYGMVSGNQADALGDGHDFTYRDLNVFPVSTSAVWRLSDDGAPVDEGSTALAVSVFVPDALRTNDRDKLGSNQNAFFVSTEQQTVWTGLTWSRRWGRVGIGASGFFLYGTALSELELTAVSATSSSQFVTLSSRVDETTFGFVGGVGLRWDATDDLRFGLSAYSPEVGWGSRRSFARIVVGDDTTGAGQPANIVVVNAEGLSASPTLPVRLQAGLAWTLGKTLFTLDATYLGARTVRDDEQRAAEGLDRYVKRHAVVNGAAGLETWLSDKVPLRLGLFTDFAATDPPVASPPGAGSQNANNTTHVNRYGGTASVGVRTEHTATDAGLNVSYGSGTDLVPNNLNFADLKPTSATQLLVYVFLASAYEF